MKHFVATAFALIACFLVIGVISVSFTQISHTSQDTYEGYNSGSASSSNQSLFPSGEICIRQVNSSLNAQHLSFRNDSDTKVSCSLLEEHLQNAKNCPNSEAREQVVSDIDRFVLSVCREYEMVVCTGPGWYSRIFNFFGF